MNKFLKLIKELFFYTYKRLQEQNIDAMYRLDNFLIEKILFHPNSKGILLEFFYNFNSLQESLSMKTAADLFLFYKPLFDVLLYQEDKSIQRTIVDRCWEHLRNYLEN